MKIEKTPDTGLCFGLKRTISILEKAAHERGGIETLGPVVHNQQVLQRLAEIGIKAVKNIDEIQGNIVAIGAHGVSPQVEEELRGRNIEIIDTTCPFVHRAQRAARRLAESGFFVIVYGDTDHAEVKGILGWAHDKGMATLDEKLVTRLTPVPRRLGALSQTTQVPARFVEFIKRLIDYTFARDSELHVVDTICHDIRERQATALELAKRVDLMLVVGDRHSANTNRLAELCSTITETYLVETAEEIKPFWFQGKHHVGITAGTSTPDESINEVLARLKAMP